MHQPLSKIIKTCWQTHLTYETTEAEKERPLRLTHPESGHAKWEQERCVTEERCLCVCQCDCEFVWLRACLIVSLFDCYCVRSCFLQFQNKPFLPFSRLTQIVTKIWVFCSCEHSTPRTQHWRGTGAIRQVVLKCFF